MSWKILNSHGNGFNAVDWYRSQNEEDFVFNLSKDTVLIGNYDGWFLNDLKIKQSLAQSIYEDKIEDVFIKDNNKVKKLENKINKIKSKYRRRV